MLILFESMCSLAQQMFCILYYAIEKKMQCFRLINICVGSTNENKKESLCCQSISNIFPLTQIHLQEI